MNPNFNQDDFELSEDRTDEVVIADEKRMLEAMADNAYRRGWSESEDNPQNLIDDREVMNLLLSKFGERDKSLVQEYYGEKHVTFAALGAKYSMTRERARQIIATSVAAMHSMYLQYLQRLEVGDYRFLSRARKSDSWMRFLERMHLSAEVLK